MAFHRALLLLFVGILHTASALAGNTPRTPPFINNPMDYSLHAGGTPIVVNLPSLLTGPPTGTLTFATSGTVPSWVTLSATAQTMTIAPPSTTTPNTYTFNITATDSATPEQSDIGQINITVTAPLKPPTWTVNPIDFTTDANVAFNKSIAADATDPQGLALTFSLNTGGPAWLSMDASGNLSGTPTTANLGANSYTVVVTDSAGLTAQASLVITVVGPPTWLQNPINLTAKENVAFSASIAADAKDAQGETLTFSLATGGPAWLSMNAAGNLTGTPAAANLGANNYTVTVTNTSGLSAQASLIVTVDGPPAWTVNPINLTAIAGTAFSASIASDAKDAQGLPLTFSLATGGPAWLSMDSSGNLTGTPQIANLGANNYTVTVSNSVGLSAQASLIVTVEAGPTWLVNPINLTADAGLPFSASIANDAKDPAGLALTFTLAGGPAWLTMDTKGNLTGTPATTNVGANTYTVTATNTEGLSANATLIVTVSLVPQPPIWLKNPILFTTVANVPFTASIAADAKDPIGLPLTFSLDNTAATWLSMDTSGNLTGTPGTANAGPNQYQVTVMNSAGLSANATLIVTVEVPPIWLQNPIDFNAVVSVPFSQSIAADAKDPAGLALTFSLGAGPAWLTMSATGQLSGTPATTNEGLNTWPVTVTDSAGLSSSATLNIMVNAGPYWLQNPITFTTIATLPFTASIAADAKDPQNLPMTFSIAAGGPAWLSMDSAGNLSGTPANSNVGANTYTVTVTDSAGLSASATLIVTVNLSTQPPIWLLNPITFNAQATVPFSASIANDAKDPLGLALTFSLNPGGNAWLSMDSKGNLSGTPTRTDVGTDTYTVTVTNTAGLTASAQLIITVTQPTNTQTITVDAPVPGAQVELLWNIDNSNSCDPGTQDFQNNVQYFFSALETAGIHDSGVLISADAKQFDGVPVSDSKEGMLMLWSSTDIVADFLYHFNLAYSGGECDNCDNSPIWSMQRLTDQLPTFSIYQNGYDMPGIPVDSMIFTEQTDHYQNYDKGTQYAKYAPADFANEWIGLFAKNQKGLRISAITPECPSLKDNSKQKATDMNPYQPLVTTTNGTYYTEGCTLNWESVFQDYASKVIRRAYIDAKQVIPLTKTPYDPTQIVVKLGGTVLPGNTGAATDEWTYDKTQNAVIIYWYKINDTAIPNGAQLTITYPI